MDDKAQAITTFVGHGQNHGHIQMLPHRVPGVPVADATDPGTGTTVPNHPMVGWAMAITAAPIDAALRYLGPSVGGGFLMAFT
ncbi:hypothetical protein O1611_g9506 [Lasiodiplodia mahajangana]|uniref:Uncharacterized protein n=1 Tax=Lasiodiplodia mahajangana TaxID=1108764 RepID=A0ACC2J8N2_9PEZI|nr:hypothetical protein O1611_g9506 [Lasiodiplodia mahajangana]